MANSRPLIEVQIPLELDVAPAVLPTDHIEVAKTHKGSRAVLGRTRIPSPCPPIPIAQNIRLVLLCTKSHLLFRSIVNIRRGPTLVITGSMKYENARRAKEMMRLGKHIGSEILIPSGALKSTLWQKYIQTISSRE